MQQIELKFQYSEADYQEFVRDYYWKNRGRWWILLAIALLVIIVISRGDMFDTPVNIFSVLIPLIFLAGFWWLIFRFIGKRTFGMMPHMQEQLQCGINEEELQLRGETFSSEFKWVGVQRIKETKNLFLVYNSNVSAVMLPKRAFSDQDVSLFRSIVAARPDLPVKWQL